MSAAPAAASTSRPAVIAPSDENVTVKDLRMAAALRSRSVQRALGAICKRARRAWAAIVGAKAMFFSISHSTVAHSPVFSLLAKDVEQDRLADPTQPRDDHRLLGVAALETLEQDVERLQPAGLAPDQGRGSAPAPGAYGLLRGSTLLPYQVRHGFRLERKPCLSCKTRRLLLCGAIADPGSSRRVSPAASPAAGTGCRAPRSGRSPRGARSPSPRRSRGCGRSSRRDRWGRGS